MTFGRSVAKTRRFRCEFPRFEAVDAGQASKGTPVRNTAFCCGCIEKGLVVLEETIADKLAQLLIEAAKAREWASKFGQPAADRILNDAYKLEFEVIKWERRLNWWKVLRERRKPT